jgi:hypothetical protein
LLDNREVLVDDDIRYWGNLLGAGIFLPLWFAVVLGLALGAWIKAPWSRLGKLALGTAVGFGILSVGYLVLAVWNPSWYRSVADPVTRLLLFPILFSFFVTLGSVIASFQKTEEGRFLVLKVLAVIGAGVLGLNASQVYLDGGAKVLADILSGLMLLGGLVMAQRGQTRLEERR